MTMTEEKAAEKPRRVLGVEPSRTTKRREVVEEEVVPSAEPTQVNPHQEAINALVARVLPRVRQLPFAQNEKHPWLGNATVDKAVLAAITVVFMLADEDRAAHIAATEAETVAEDASETPDDEVTAVVEQPPEVLAEATPSLAEIPPPAPTAEVEFDQS